MSPHFLENTSSNYNFEHLSASLPYDLYSNNNMLVDLPQFSVFLFIVFTMRYDLSVKRKLLLGVLTYANHYSIARIYIY